KAEQTEEVEGNRRRVRGRQLVPPTTPAEEPVRGKVRLVRNGTVRVALRVRGLAPPVRLDAVTDLAVFVGPSAGFLRGLDRKVPVGSLADRDPLGADDAGVAHVDHVRALDVEAYPEADEEDRCRGQQPHRPERARSRDLVI